MNNLIKLLYGDLFRQGYKELASVNRTDKVAKKFQRTIENFICDRCGTKVKGGGYTNHCPNCLYSKHVDINPGDRQSDCKGLMEPVGLETSHGDYILLHKCVKCSFLKKNKVAKNDNFEELLRLSKSIA